MSMKPGATTWPLASMTRRAWPVRSGPTPTTRSFSTATSARRRGAPVPSTTSPPRIRSDQATLLLDDDHGRHPVPLLDPVHVLDPRHHLTEHRVVAVEVRLGAISDVELAAGRIGMLTARHGQRAPAVLVLVELRLDRVPGPAGAVALGVATLDDEARHHPV